MAGFRDGKWYCHCNDQAKLYTSGKGLTNGQRCMLIAYFVKPKFDSHGLRSLTANGIAVYRCPNRDNGQCSFFLWEKDEAREIPNYANESSPSPPQIPQNQYRRGASEAPPSQASTIQRNPDSSEQTSSYYNTVQSPGSPSRASGKGQDTLLSTFNNLKVDASKDEAINLFDDVRSILARHNIELRTSTQSLLRNAINKRMGVYQQQIRTLEESVEDLAQKLDEAES